MKNQSLEQFVSFPDGVRVILDKVNKSGPLGTSAVVSLFVDCLLTLTEDSSAQSSRELFCEVVDLLDYFHSTRGQYSVAVENSFQPLTAKLHDLLFENFLTTHPLPQPRSKKLKLLFEILVFFVIISSIAPTDEA